MIQTPLGNQRIETLKIGDEVLTRDEMNPEVPWSFGTVENTVRRTATLWRLQVNGREILTTDEHPFWVIGQGWVNANQIKLNGKLRTLNGEVTVELSENTGEVAEVFNVSIDPSHTYFVGGDDWGFVVWSHNINPCVQPTPPKVHGNTAGNQQATLYEKYDKNGNFQKHGISQDPSKRYTKKELDGGYLIETQTGPRKEMLKIERNNVETNPGPQNKEPWAGKRRGK